MVKDGMKLAGISPWPLILAGSLAAAAHGGKALKFEKKKLDNHNNEACAFGDFSGDGKLDLACADAWYENPAWTKRTFKGDNGGNDYMDAMDVDGDGRVDILAGGPNRWFKNPGQAGGIWPVGGDLNVYHIHSGNLWDVDGDGKARELVTAEASRPTVWAEFKNGKWTAYTVSTTVHNWGSGVGDVNGDGRPDIIRPDAWYEAPADPRAGQWIAHEIAIGALEEMPTKTVKPQRYDHPIWEWNNATGMFGHTVQIYAYDVDGDKLNDLIASSGHRMGVMWYKQIRDARGITFRPEVVDGSVSEVHALELVDLDKDGDRDLIASKRWRGHPAFDDPLSEDPLFVYWYEHVKERPYWKRHTISYGENISAGTKIAVGDYDQDGDLDLAVIAKNQEGRGGGPWLFENKYPETVDEPETPGAQFSWVKRKLGDEKNLTCAFVDMDRDGKLDVAGGDFWYRAPNWDPVRFRALGGAGADGLSEALDVDGDGWTDLVSGSYGKGLRWFKNPGAAPGDWPVAVADTQGNYENGELWDVDGDGKAREIVSSAYRPGVKWWEVKDGKWVSHAVSTQSCNFGAGVGDVNGDRRPDIIRPDAWFEAPADPRLGTWKAHTIALGAIDDRGKAAMQAPEWMGVNAKGRHRHTGQIHVLDVNKDGRNDLVASSAHGIGIFWYEQKDPDTFERRTIDATFSQAHALELKDMDGDGDPDLVTGKAYRAGGDHDPQTGNPLLVVWYELVPGAKVPWIKHEITYGENIGAGFNIAVADYDGDGDMDIAATGMHGGPWLFESRLKTPTGIAKGGPVPAKASGRGFRFTGGGMTVPNPRAGMRLEARPDGKLNESGREETR